MAKTSGLGDQYLLGGYDLSGDVNALGKIAAPMAVGDTTAINKSAHERIGLHRDGQIDFTTLFESTSTPTTPGVPASTVAVTSTYNFYVLVTITGGTMTNVTVNGSTVGSGAGTYVLPPLGSISMTYTVAPTWNWTAVKTEHDILSTLPRTDVVCSYLRGTTVLNPAASMVAKQVNYDLTRANDGMLTAAVSALGNSYGLDWGVQLTAGLRTDTTATTGTFVDLGAGTTYGGQAYLQLVGFVGTSVDVTITHATTSGGAYSTLVDFGAQTAVGGFRVALSNTTTVNEFVKVVTSGTFTYAKFAVMFTQNKTAGVTF